MMDAREEAKEEQEQAFTNQKGIIVVDRYNTCYLIHESYHKIQQKQHHLHHLDVLLLSPGHTRLAMRLVIRASMESMSAAGRFILQVYQSA